MFHKGNELVDIESPVQRQGKRQWKKSSVSCCFVCVCVCDIMIMMGAREPEIRITTVTFSHLTFMPLITILVRLEINQAGEKVYIFFW